MPYAHVMSPLRTLTVLLSLTVVLGLVAVPATAVSASQPAPAATIELRAWQDVEDERRIFVSARQATGSWSTLGIVPLPLDDGLSTSGAYRYGDTRFDIPLEDSAFLVRVEMRIWQYVLDDRRLYISARGTGGSWDALGTVRLSLDGFSPARNLRYGDVALEVPLPAGGVVSLAGLAGEHGYADGRGAEARFGHLFEHHMGVDVDHDGNVIVADFRNRAIRRISGDGTAETIAGGNGRGLRDGPAETSQFDGPSDVAVDSAGAIYVADSYANRIRKITPDGQVMTVAGAAHPEGQPWYPRGGRADEALFLAPQRLAFGPNGDLYIMERTSIRRLSPSGWVSLYAGGSAIGYRDGPREDAQFGALQAIDVDAEGNLYVIDVTAAFSGKAGHAVRKIDTSGRVSTLYRSDAPRYGGVLASPSGIVVTAEGDIYVTNTGRNQVVRVEGPDRIVAVAGTGADGVLDGPRETARFSKPGALAATRDGALIVVDQSDSIIRVVRPDADGGLSAVPQAAIRTVPAVEGVEVRAFAGQGAFAGGVVSDLDIHIRGFVDGSARNALLAYPRGLAWDVDGSILVVDRGNHAIRRVAADGSVTTVAGGNGEGDSDGGRAVAQFTWPTRVAADSAGVMYVAELRGTNRVRRVARDGSIATLWLGLWTYQPAELAVDPDGNLLLNLWGRIVRVFPDGSVSIVANEGHTSSSGFAVDEEGSVYYVQDTHATTTIRKADADGMLSTVFEGVAGAYGGVFSRDVTGLAVASDGTLYASDRTYQQVVRISPEGAASVVVDEDQFSRSFSPWAILVTPEGDLLVSDSSAHAIWKITLRE